MTLTLVWNSTWSNLHGPTSSNKYKNNWIKKCNHSINTTKVSNIVCLDFKARAATNPMNYVVFHIWSGHLRNAHHQPFMNVITTSSPIQLCASWHPLHCGILLNYHEPYVGLHLHKQPRRRRRQVPLLPRLSPNHHFHLKSCVHSSRFTTRVIRSLHQRLLMQR